ncbi:hypothetical protein VTN96DRAFT_10079 [Rasamsonia emersonii]|uniref:Major facilitator superfamily (MFS) profile domain-containing protein n=1 Tax=Rasamsonia emersonii (strain ATCC 16479 / CBS 393.64 / IMI 116815) TaxID=1408163 RepID=A0A0F4YXR1_RASE3|nr:Uncharacterized protein T310_2908 [Rasamsonia emersonii CBS 393.64]KKA23029.1 Uncharacterized protein T310_2908 [Rasamsonia emersonii CBS 393.64]
MAANSHGKPPGQPEAPASSTESTVSVASNINQGKDGEAAPQLGEPGQLQEPTKEAANDLEKAENAANVNAGPPAMSPPPDGGLQAWLVVLGGFCVLFVSFGWINCIGVFQEYYQTHQLSNMSSSTVAWIPSIETFMMFFWGPVFGRLFDSFGPRWLLLFGSFFHVFGLMMTSISSEYYQFILAQSICSATGASAVFFASTTSVSTWFHHRRALALGVTVSGSSLGGVIFPIMVDHLVREVGFGWAMRICAFLILFLLIIANLTIKSRLPHRPKRVVIMEFIRPLREPPFLLFLLGSFLFFLGMFLPFNFIILEAERWGMSPSLANYLIPILNAASVFGRTLPGYLADRIGRFNMMILMTYFSGIIVLALWLPTKSNAPIIVFSALYGFGSGAFVSLGPAIMAQISPVRELGIRQGTYFALISIAALIGNPIGGALVPNVVTGEFWKLQVFTGVVLMVGSTIIVFARISAGGPNPLTKV